MRIPLLFLILLLAATSCSPEPPVDPDYRAEVESWRERRVASLKSESGWLNLAGLFWLRPGTLRFGSDASNDIVFPAAAPPILGVFEVTDSTVTVVVDPGAEVTSNGESVKRLLLKPDTHPDEDAPTELANGSLRWWLIDRGGRLGIRLRDLENPSVAAFRGIDYFPIDPQWRVEARLEAHPEPVEIAVPTIMGTIARVPSPGSVVFEVDGEVHRLDPVGSLGERLFLVFGDATTGRETYGGGRFLYFDSPDSSGTAIIDFNLAYNPPCAFTPYSTCQQPPAQNYLIVAVEAGEKDYHQDE